MNNARIYLHKNNIIRFFLFIFLFASSQAFSQDIGYLFKDYFGTQIKNNKTYLNQISAGLSEFASLNPELIYYSIKYFNALKDTSEDRFYLENFSKIRNNYYCRYMDWLKKLKNEISNETQDKELSEIAEDYVDDYIDDAKMNPVPGLETKTDANFMNFLVVKYYLYDEKIKYNAEENYSEQRRSLEIKKIAPFVEMQINPSKYSKKDLEELISNWYIIQRQDDSNIETGTVKVSEIILNVLKAKYSNSYIPKTNISAGYSYFINSMMPEKDIYGPLFSYPDLEYSFNNQAVTASYDYKIFLAHYIGILNYINFELSAAYAPAGRGYQAENFTNIKRNVDGISNRSEVFESSNSRLSIQNAVYFGTNITIPIIYVGKSFSIDGGFSLIVSDVNYKINYDYVYRKFESEFLGPRYIYRESGKNVERKGNILKFLPSPVIYFNSYLSDWLSMRIITTVSSLSLKFGVSI